MKNILEMTHSTYKTATFSQHIYLLHIYIDIQLQIIKYICSYKNILHTINRTLDIQTKINTFQLKITPSYDRSIAIAVLQHFSSYYGQQMANRLGIAFSLIMFDY